MVPSLDLCCCPFYWIRLVLLLVVKPFEFYNNCRFFFFFFLIRELGWIVCVYAAEEEEEEEARVGSFVKRKKNSSSPDHHAESPPKNDLAHQRWSFSGGSLPSTPRKSADGSKRNSLLRKAGFERAVEVLDVLGSGVANLNSGGFMSSFNAKGRKISVLAFEVANTITKGATLMYSLSEENVRDMKQKMLSSEGILNLVSSDVNVLLNIIAEDKRHERDVFIREVVRFGGLCKDPQWHNLDRYFEKLGVENVACKPARSQAEFKMNELLIWAQSTAELYHELNALDRFEQDYRQKREEVESFNLPRRGGTFTVLQSELRHQRKIVLSLKRKSLWCKTLEEVIEKLIDVIAFIHLNFMQVFGNSATDAEAAQGVEPSKFPERLGTAGLALHYANIINQIDSLASRPTFLPPNIRDSLYRGLPADIKTGLRISLKRHNTMEELTLPQIKAEIEKTLVWLVPMASSTSKMYQGFGWIGEWANTSYDFSKQNPTPAKPARLQSLYHADKKKTESYILELLKWLHILIRKIKNRDYNYHTNNKNHQPPLAVKSHSYSLSSSNAPSLPSSFNNNGKTQMMPAELTSEERELVEKVSMRQLLPLVSKSQEFSIRIHHRRSFNHIGPSQSMGSSPFQGLTRGLQCDEEESLELIT